ncbi:DMT family transporter [Aquisalimonas lutea]|uniref:DMT family transporter n=1 Tax=Aquisalimonas lutea TaxID=1327750 RepID=UPI0025B29F78|nr:DMT family transporter [Aquisalimonas lutea]MDN3519858.1 DMT family transporter [Aquisalimonas lutea]
MAGRTVHSAIILLATGNLLALLSDVIIKWQGTAGEFPVLQFIFMRVMVAVLVLLPLWRHLDGRAAFRGTGVHVLRAHIGLAGISCMAIALTTLPLATANALFYATPLLVMVLAVLLFGERVTGLSLLAVVSGFAGILVILRPVEISWAALSGLGAALALATNALLVRKLPSTQSTVHKLFLMHLYAVPAAFALMLWEGAAWDWRMLVAAAGSAVFILGYNATVLLAYRHVAANQVTSAEYTGLIWAVLFGWWWFGEVPGIWFFLGTTLIVSPLIALGIVERRRVRCQVTTDISPIRAK